MKLLIEQLGLVLYTGRYRRVSGYDEYCKAIHIYIPCPYKKSVVNEMLWKYLYE